MTDLRQLPSNQSWDQTARVILNAALKYLSDLLGAANTWTGTNNFTGAIQSNGVSIVPFGKHKIWIPSKEMTANPVLTPAAAVWNPGGNTILDVWDFDQAAVERTHFNIGMPSSWNEGTVTFVPIWSAAAGTGDVVWVLDGWSFSNDDSLTQTVVTSVTSTDTLIATGDLHRGPESAALTIDGTPSANDVVAFRVYRLATDAGDTLNADARLIGIELYFTTDAAVDAA